MSDANATYSYTYDAAGEVTEETQQIAGLTPTITFNEQYTAGNRTQLAASIGGTNDFVNNYQYNSVLGQMSQETQSGVSGGDAVAEKSVTFAYDNLGEFSTITPLRGPAHRRNWSPSPRTATTILANLTSLDYAKSGGSHAASTSAGPTTRWATWQRRAERSDGTVTYGSDSTGQLTASGSQTSQSYVYDANGNRETVTTSGNR